MLRPALLLAFLASPLAHAADKATEKAAAPPPVKAGWTLLPDEVPDAKYERLVNEDDNLRTVEIRERGQVKKVTVHLKNSRLPDYEILVRNAKYDTNRHAGPAREGIMGTRVWSVADF